MEPLDVCYKWIPKRPMTLLNGRLFKAILKELSFPNQFINWIMLTVTTVSYRFQVNYELSRLVKANRGLRQGDPLTPIVICCHYGVYAQSAG